MTRAVLATLIREAAAAAPRECCGLLLGEGSRVTEARPAANVSPEPLVRFEIDPAVLLAAHKASRSGGPQVIGYYHSHPAGHPAPSAVDCEHSTGDLRVWAIVGGGEVAFWRDTGEGFAGIHHVVIDG